MTGSTPGVPSIAQLRRDMNRWTEKAKRADAKVKKATAIREQFEAEARRARMAIVRAGGRVRRG